MSSTPAARQLVTSQCWTHQPLAYLTHGYACVLCFSSPTERGGSFSALFARCTASIADLRCLRCWCDVDNCHFGHSRLPAFSAGVQ